MNDLTLKYYNENADKFINNTLEVDFHSTQDHFLELLPAGAFILDFGCGSGRDSKYFLDRGCRVEATDGSEELCRLASDYAGIPVKQMLFQELEEVAVYEGIWACSSILHLPRQELKDVLFRMCRALKEGGIIYTSFKYGSFEGMRNGRYFTDFTRESFAEFIKDLPGLQLKEEWISSDVRPGREEEKWLNLILCVSGHMPLA